uniref:hypothetical protein n=1 Tax=Algoriphagus sp. TaxID=1872435 RepID=UPI00404717E8
MGEKKVISQVVTLYYQLLLDCSYSMEPIWEKLQSQVGAHFQRLQKEIGTQSIPDSNRLFRLVSIPTTMEFPSFSSSLNPLLLQLAQLVPSGSSALSDTLMEVITQIQEACTIGTNSKSTYFLAIITDGWENGSNYKASQVAELLLELPQNLSLELWVIGPEQHLPFGTKKLPLIGLEKQFFAEEDLEFYFQEVEKQIQLF